MYLFVGTPLTARVTHNNQAPQYDMAITNTATTIFTGYDTPYISSRLYPSKSLSSNSKAKLSLNLSSSAVLRT